MELLLVLASLVGSGITSKEGWQKINPWAIFTGQELKHLTFGTAIWKERFALESVQRLKL